MACECLQDLKIWAFLEVSFVARLLHARLTQRKQLNKIRVRKNDRYCLNPHILRCSRTHRDNTCANHYIFQVRIYSENDTTEKQEQLEEILFSQQQNSPELNFYAIVFPFVVG